ncbi:MAG: NADH-quinone oxidoreductase subunit J [Coriobacteriales bacterium]|nr:NADH-quinone oxidoreductase subunit J [Coriobacteriales bacterium]
MTAIVVFWLLSALAIAGALLAITSRDVLRTAGGLGAFLLAVAGFFALYGAGLIALAEIFLYVGGVLVLILFAMMLVHRSERGRPDLESRPSVAAVFASAAFVVALIGVLAPAAVLPRAATNMSTPSDVAELLLGTYLPQFEIAGVLLLAGLAAVVAVMGGDDR